MEKGNECFQYALYEISKELLKLLIKAKKNNSY